ncbi:hypothetical protein [Opitutus terrae]|uniref:Uncharacterized protein n=1 Tax=Opitutus terrae (strain DSM 11246 / JCM 15787 / PB90-1) TaxID=452637 RepID=B1ZY27_OPITP|nr:hypothetical protein [Opitutus terrae]ACB75226.1 hypothetical protein Oter_1943 [Opitutus terrae PB90-1]
MSTTAPGDAVSLTLHFANGDLLSLPWSRYLGACLTGDQLVISFAEREVEIHGRNLGQVMEAIECSSLTGLRVLPSAYAGLAATAPFVSKLSACPRPRTSK